MIASRLQEGIICEVHGAWHTVVRAHCAEMVQALVDVGGRELLMMTDKSARSCIC